MAAYRLVYDSRHLQADCPRTGISSGTLGTCSVIEYGLPLPFYLYNDSSIKPENLAKICPVDVEIIGLTEIGKISK